MHIQVKKVTNCTVHGDGNDIIFNNSVGKKVYELRAFTGTIHWGVHVDTLVMSIISSTGLQEYRLIKGAYAPDEPLKEEEKEIEVIEI